MEEQEAKDEELNTNLVGTNTEDKWKKVFIIILITTICAFVLLGTFALLYFLDNKDNNKDNKSNSSDSEKNPEDKWDWKPAGDRIKTQWGIDLNPKKVWQEYPRPQIERKEWMNLNGPWKYAIRNKDELDPDEYDGYILVPFPLESSLSGVMKNLSATDIIIYEKTVTIPKEWEGKQIVLNFGAVDWKCEVFINKLKVGEHTGGYSYFYFDITDYIKGSQFNITLRVQDVTDTYYLDWGKYQPVGKQTITPSGIWYTPASGIWQTVWLEPVNIHHIERVDINNNFDDKEIKITFRGANNFKLPLECNVKYNDKIVGSGKGLSNEEIRINVTDNFHPWSPSEPNLYIIEAILKADNGDILDNITSYTAIRKIESRELPGTGNHTIYLNNKPLFSLGPLDQGYWPDGIYTPPSEEAMLFDIKTMKNLGFNTLRKHAKTESFRYYYQCDKLGMLVWQDMPHGNLDGSGSWNDSDINLGSDTVRTPQSKDNYYKEWEGIIQNLKFFQSIIIWTPFNEAWGQFDTEAVVDYTKARDSSRLINAASGGNHRLCGNFIDKHSYPGPSYPLNDYGLIKVVGEYGGMGLEIKNHTWKKDNWAYYVVNNSEELTGNYTLFIGTLKNLVSQKKISGAIYTQVTDVEGEINGLVTYDRKIVKIYDRIKKDNEELIASLHE